MPFEYMELRCSVLNAATSTLYSCETRWDGAVIGHPNMSEELIYRDILTRDFVQSDILFDTLRWYARCYGLVLKSVLDSGNEYARPQRMV